LIKKALVISIIFLFIFSSIRVNAFETSFLMDKELSSISQINVTFESSNYRLYGEIYYPSNESAIYPGIIFCEGFAGFVEAYSWLPKALAEEGYVVLIFDFPGQGKSEGFFSSHGIHLPFLNLYIRLGVKIETPIQYLSGNWIKATSDALTYLIEESPVQHITNSSCIGFIGHSLGAIAVTKTATIDDRVDCIVIYTHTNPLILENINVPIQFQGGTSDIGFFSMPILSLGYLKANTPKESIMIKQGTHTGFTTSGGPFCRCPEWQKDICLHYTIGWLDYFLKNKPDAYDIITTGVDNLSKVIKSKYNFGDGDHFLE